MNVTEEKLDDQYVMLKAQASPAEVNHAFEMAQVNFARQMGIQPDQDTTIAQLAEEQLGVKDLDAVVQPQVPEYLVPYAVDKCNLMPAFPPQAEPGQPAVRNQPYSFKTKVMLTPEFELDSYDPVTIEVPPFSFDETEVDRYFDQLADNYATFETDEPHPVGQGDSFLLALDATHAGEHMDNLSTDGRTYIMGMHLMPPDFEQQLMGMDVGESKSFSFEMPGAGGDGKPGTVDCTVRVLAMQRKILPTIDDEWVQKNMPVFKSAAELRDDVAERLKSDHEAQYEADKLQMAAAELAKRFNGDIDDAIIESTKKTLENNLRIQAAQQGASFEQFVQSEGGRQKFDAALEQQTRATLAQGYALDALFRHENLTLSGADLNEAGAAMNPNNPAQIRHDMEENGRGFALRELAQRIKSNRWLLDHASVVVKEQDTAE